MEEKNTKKNGLTTAGLVLGIIAIVISFIPFINVFSFILGILAFIFGIISLAQKKDKGTSIAAIILGVLAIVIMYVINYSTSNVINKGVQEFNNSISSGDSSSSTTKIEEKNYINLGETVTTKDWEISIESAEFSQRVDPPNKSGYYNYYQVEDSDDTYLYIVLNCKNISTLDIKADKVATVNVKYKNSYKYSSFSTIPSSTLGFTYTNITNIEPLTSDQIYYLAKMPKTVEEDTESPIEVEIKVKDTTYIYKYR